MSISTEFIMLNYTQYLNEWEKLSFTLFGDEVDEMLKFIELCRKAYKEEAVEALEAVKTMGALGALEAVKALELVDDTKVVDDMGTVEFFHHLVARNCGVTMDAVMMKLINDEKKRGPRHQPYLYRFSRAGIDFDRTWERESQIPPYIRYRLFFAPCVYPNVIRALSPTSLIELAAERYPERYAKFLDNFKKNNTVLFDNLGEVAMLVLEYIQPAIIPQEPSQWWSCRR